MPRLLRGLVLSRVTAVAGGLALGCAVAAWIVARPPQPVQAEGYALDELSPSDEAAIERGLERLVGLRSEQTGAFGEGYKVASTSLAGLALLGSGDHYARGEHGEAIRGAVNFLLSEDVRQTPQPGQVFFSDGEASGRMHAHGYAMLFLAQVYGHTDRDPEIAEALRGAVQTSQQAQAANGGYGYQLRGEPGFGEDEASVTITQIQGLRAARDAGFLVDKGTIDDAIDYIRKSMGPDGSVCYSLTSAPERRTYELTAAAVATLHAAGVYQGSDHLDRGLDYMRRRMRVFRSVDRAAETFYYYGNLYAAEAMFQAGGEDWTGWFPGTRQALLDKQLDGGGWKPENGDYGEAYATACALIILQLPKRYLPSFQR